VRKELKNEYWEAYWPNHGPVLIFARTKFGAARLVKNLRGMKHSAAEIHSTVFKPTP